jgi:tetratricopeptide (TPR) repeat protein
MRKHASVSGLLAAVIAATASAQSAVDDGTASTAPWAAEQAHEEAGNFEAAIRDCMQILRQHPTDPRTMNTIAGLDGKLGRFRDEITWARRAIAVDPSYFQAEINLGNALAPLGQVKQAQAAFERARQLAPNDPIPVYSLGVLAENRHDVAAATALYERSVALAPKFDSGWFNLAAMYATAGRFDDALAALDKVLALNPHAEDARAMRRHVEADKAAKAR